ncbi:Pimeloyl-ACP methyl ester carboxylesterase [Ekhidna lutea]|uniref:Pimeloyl-ACP methyl ester carboxylesterase n=1 Tax=Ekhidna lutea TaxID=447679 RepID=A0A239LJV4_EKHLU|nr:alpha/beta hydrolase [Ekhidna lutea]SNT30168.1 Pimeloyl-ACP methyl ester carboxylesterase [Ekhidna lutea]
MTKVESTNGQLHYSIYPGGERILLAFHGFGQDNKIFESWSKTLGDDYTIYAFDIFYHGKSSRDYGNLTKNEWAQYLQKFLQNENIKEFTIVGFSLGGRFAISSALSFPTQTQELILIAPDGVFLTIWFKLATNPSTRWLFKYFMLNPKKLEQLLRFNDKYKIVSSYLRDFVQKELGNPENRKRVYISWNHFKTLGYGKKQLAKEFKTAQFKRRIILGEKDHIIKPAKILPIIKTMGEFEVDILPMKHHQLVKPEIAKLIMKNTV